MITIYSIHLRMRWKTGRPNMTMINQAVSQRVAQVRKSFLKMMHFVLKMMNCVLKLIMLCVA